jgi:hypothetical protein
MKNDESEIKQFMSYINSRTKSLKFTFELSDKQVPFLDILVKKDSCWLDQHKLSTSLYEKPTNKHLYTSPDTYAPDHHKYSWLTGENIRLLRIHSNKDEYEHAISNFKQNLANRDFAPDIIDKMIKYRYEDRNIFLSPNLKVSSQQTWNFITVRNIPGRDLVETALLQALDSYKTSLSLTKNTLPSIVIKRGRKLIDFINITSKKVLLNSKKQSENSKQIVEDREDSTKKTNLNKRKINELNNNNINLLNNKFIQPLSTKAEERIFRETGTPVPGSRQVLITTPLSIHPKKPKFI